MMDIEKINSVLNRAIIEIQERELDESWAYMSEKSDPSSMKVQTLIFDKGSFSKKSAVQWAKSHGFKASKVDEKENTFRIRQKDPGGFGTFRTITFKKGLKAVVAKS